MLTNSQRGDVLNFAVNNSLISHAGIFELWQWLFVVVEGTELNAYRLGEYLMPPWTRPVHKLFNSRLEIADWIAQDPCPLLRSVNRYLDLLGY